MKTRPKAIFDSSFLIALGDKRDRYHRTALEFVAEDAELDFVDSCVAAMAERMDIQHIATFDRRDFSIIQPTHTSYFHLLPSPIA